LHPWSFALFSSVDSLFGIRYLCGSEAWIPRSGFPTIVIDGMHKNLWAGIHSKRLVLEWSSFR
jgi:hypothetical protein